MKKLITFLLVLYAITASAQVSIYSGFDPNSISVEIGDSTAVLRIELGDSTSAIRIALSDSAAAHLEQIADLQDTTVAHNTRLINYLIGNYLVGSPVMAAMGAGNFYSFNDADSYGSVAIDDNLRFGTTDFTIDLTVRNESIGDGDMALDIGDNSNCYITFWGSGRLDFGLYDGSNSASLSPTDIGITADEWVNITIACERGEDAIVYMNGDSVASVDISGIGDIQPTGNLLIGKTSGGTAPYFDGDISRVRIYKSYLTEAQVKKLNAGSREAFDQCVLDLSSLKSSTIWYDQSGNGLNVSMSNTTLGGQVEFSALVDTASAHWTRIQSIEGDVSTNASDISLKLNKADSTQHTADSFASRSALTDTASAHWTRIQSVEDAADALPDISGYGYVEKTVDVFTLGDSVFCDFYQLDEHYDNMEQVNEDTMMVLMYDSLAFFDISNPASVPYPDQIMVNNGYPLGITMMDDSRLAVVAKRTNNQAAIVLYDTQNPASMTDWGKEDSLRWAYIGTGFIKPETSYLFDVGDYVVFLHKKDGTPDDSLQAVTFEIDQTTKQIVGVVDSAYVDWWANTNTDYVDVVQLGQKEYFVSTVNTLSDVKEAVYTFKVDSTTGIITARVGTLSPGFGESNTSWTNVFAATGDNLVSAYSPSSDNSVYFSTWRMADGIGTKISDDTLHLSTGSVRSLNFYGEDKIAMQQSVGSYPTRMHLIDYSDMANPVAMDSIYMDSDRASGTQKFPTTLNTDSTKIFTVHIQDNWDWEYRVGSIATGGWSASYALDDSISSIRSAISDTASALRTVISDTASAIRSAIPSVRSVANLGARVSSDCYYFEEDDSCIVYDTAKMDDIFDDEGFFSTWVYVEDAVSPEIINGQILQVNNAYNLGITDADQTSFGLRFLQEFSVSSGYWDTEDILLANRWYHIGVKYDNTSTSNDPTIYINGVPYTVGDGLTEGSTPSGTRLSDDGEDKILGGSALGTSHTFTGYMSQARFWNMPPTDAEVVNFYETGIIPFKYQEAENTELVTDEDLSEWTGDTPDEWSQTGESAGTRDITHETVEVPAGYSDAVKLEATGNDGTAFRIDQTVSGLIIGKHYRVTAKYHYATRTAGTLIIRLYDAVVSNITVTSATAQTGDWTYVSTEFEAEDNSYTYQVLLNSETDGVAYVTALSVKQIGCVCDLNKSKTSNIWFDDSGNDINGYNVGIDLYNGEGISYAKFGPLLDYSTGIDHTYTGNRAYMTVGENVSFGELLYMKSDGKLWKADASSTTTMPTICVALEAISADSQGLVGLSGGFLYDDSFSLTIGGLVYTSSASGALTQSAPASSGDQVQAVGVAVTAKIVHLLISPVLVEVE